MGLLVVATFFEEVITRVCVPGRKWHQFLEVVQKLGHLFLVQNIGGPGFYFCKTFLYSPEGKMIIEIPGRVEIALNLLNKCNLQRFGDTIKNRQPSKDCCCNS
jgi:hypothetical protein